MKQIYVGPVSRSEQQNVIRQMLKMPRWILVGVIVIILVIPFLLKDGGSGNYGAVALVETDTGTGSAIYIGNNKLLTAAHVVSGMTVGERCTVEFMDPNDIEGRTIPALAELIAIGDYRANVPPDLDAQNCSNDFALLMVQTVDVSQVVGTPVSVGTSSNVKVSDKIKVEGFPNGTYSSTSGTVNNITGGITQNKDLFVVDAGAWPGNSGGALFNQSGQLIGIVTMTGNKASQNTDGQTMAIKIDYVAQALQMKGQIIK